MDTTKMEMTAKDETKVLAELTAMYQDDREDILEKEFAEVKFEVSQSGAPGSVMLSLSQGCHPDFPNGFFFKINVADLVRAALISGV